ncbi:MAG TPA: histidine phosphatase family protein [Allosphingosinicella sp.]|jgi:phosphohistidine phosphatase
MKTLTLLRHAKSGWDDSVARDFDRPLNPRGRCAARTVGREMRAQGLAFDSVLASPAVRVVETLEEIGSGYGRVLDPRFDQRLYLASTDTLLDLIREADDGVASLLLVGHNPGLELLVLLLTRHGGGELREQAELKYPTATLAELSLPVERWQDVREGAGTLSRFIRPRDLDPQLGPDEGT